MPAAFPTLARGGRGWVRRLRTRRRLVNRYEPGARLTLHQDKNERDYHPIVSVSLGPPAVFLFGGPNASDRSECRWRTAMWWSGAALRRLNHHGVAPLADNRHPLLGRQRFNLTLRKAG